MIRFSSTLNLCISGFFSSILGTWPIPIELGNSAVFCLKLGKTYMTASFHCLGRHLPSLKHCNNEVALDLKDFKFLFIFLFCNIQLQIFSCGMGKRDTVYNWEYVGCKINPQSLGLEADTIPTWSLLPICTFIIMTN